MKLNIFLTGAASALILAGCTGGDDVADTDAETSAAEAEAGDAAMDENAADADTAMAEKLQEAADATYSLEPNHAFLTFTVMHNGLSEYTVNFTDFDATLDFNPEDPASSSIEATIDPTALNVKYPGNYTESHPDSEFESWPEALSQDTRFFNASEYPEITFVSTSAERTGDYTGTVTGDLTFLGQTQPITLDVTYNGVGNLPWYGMRDLIGFDATGTISRSAFGQESLEGMISDEVTIEFSGEFLQNEESSATVDDSASASEASEMDSPQEEMPEEN